MSLESQKVTVTLPKDLLERLNGAIPSRKRSLFISEAIKERLDLIEQGVALDETAGLWLLGNHPTMHDDKSIDNWLQTSRQSWD